MQERRNQRAETSLGIGSARPGRGFPLWTMSPRLHREQRLVTVGRKGVGWRYRDLLAEVEAGPGVGIQRRWQKMSSTGGVGLELQNRGGHKNHPAPLQAKKNPKGWYFYPPNPKKTSKVTPKMMLVDPTPASGPSGAGVGRGVWKRGAEGERWQQRGGGGVG